jgi:putative redox protein
MIKTNSDDIRYRVRFTNGAHTAASDTTQDKGGSGSGFRPHELLEAALASCINMRLCMVADRHALPLAGVTTRVMLDRTDPEEGVFEYEIVLRGPLSQEDRDRLLEAAKKCPVRQTLSKRIGFRAR